jgi:hypothetical protein
VPPANATPTCTAGACGFACKVGYLRSGDSCVPNCVTTGCTGFTWCNPTSGLCEAGCAFQSQCPDPNLCDSTRHACVPAAVVEPAGQSCPAGYPFEGASCPSPPFGSPSTLCYSTSLVPGTTVRTAAQGCAAGQKEHFSYTCTLSYFVCVPDP